MPLLLALAGSAPWQTSQWTMPPLPRLYPMRLPPLQQQQTAAAVAAAHVEEQRRNNAERRRAHILPTDFGPEGMSLFSLSPPLLSISL